MPVPFINPTPPISVLHALILGFVQGVTEFLPVSSSAHIRILPALLHWPDPGAAFTAILQLGPIAAIIAFFRRDLARYVQGIGRSFKRREMYPPGDTDARLGWYTIIGTIPLGIAGILLESKVDAQYRNLYLVATALIVLALVLLVAERVSRRNRTLDTLPFGGAMLIGLSQALALVPGASRSGCTITAGLLVGLTREEAARFSFLLSIPAITLAGLFKLRKVLHGAHLGPVVAPYLLGTVVAGLVAYVVIKWLLGYLGDENHTTMPFIIYRILLGVTLLVLVHLGFVLPQ